MVQPKAMWNKSSKKQLENNPKHKWGEKMKMMQMIGVIQPMLVKIWNYIVEIIFYGLVLVSHEFIFS